MKNSRIIVDKDYQIADIDERLFGSFVEHLGRAVYSGIYEPDHPTADEQGFRQDVIDLVKELHVPIVRYPGGNFVSGYNWTDGIGPKDKRPVRLDYAWKSIETNQVGINEFSDWCRKAGSQVMAAVNMGTGSEQDAGYMIEYCNFPGGTSWSDLRKQHGYDQPHDIKVWCIGNEMDGDWQTCQLDAESYGRKARQTAKILKWVDPSVELVACGSSTTLQKTYPEWDRIVLEHVYNDVEYLSLHRYYENEGNLNDFLASSTDMSEFIKTITSICDYVKAKNRTKKQLMLSFDEWNVWYQKDQKDHGYEIAPTLIEDQYSMLDALVFGSMMCTLVNHSDRVKMACLAQLVNVIAPIMTQKGGGALRQTTFYPFRDVSNLAKGRALQLLTHCDTFESERYGTAKTLQSAASYDEATGEIVLFVVNVDQTEAHQLNIDLRSFGNVEMISRSILRHDDIYAKNTFEEPFKVVPEELAVAAANGGSSFELAIPAMSWNVMKFRCQG
ncbi:MAG: alpha-L-arabinofuranosidase [Clostridiales bacterium]|jgi:alpha-N-arabinofuranosidase|nr:alpha-L-arabinofuranosidase [Clostridiales bacterium]